MKINFFNNNGYVKEEAIGAGIYQFKLKKGDIVKSLYIGKSYSILLRCAQHVYELKKDKSYFGLTNNWDDDELELIVDIYEIVDVDKLSTSDRDILLREKELNAIIKEKPLVQLETSDRLRADRVDQVNKYLDTFNIYK